LIGSDSLDGRYGSSNGCFIAALFEEIPRMRHYRIGSGDLGAAKLLTRDKARRIANTQSAAAA
jgi:hypothetical protein